MIKDVVGLILFWIAAITIIILVFEENHEDK